MIPPDPDEKSNQQWQDSMLSLGKRSSYKEVWNKQAEDLEVAKLAVAGHTDEATFDATAVDTITTLRQTIGLTPFDIILEIGCGVGRVGKLLAPQCIHWIGTDISSGMIGHARKRLEGLDNVTLIELSGVGLREIYSNSLDVVYCTIVFMHLYEWDRYTYVAEAFRTLRPGGRCFFDNVSLSTKAGWDMFEAGRAYPLDRRPAHLSMCSTREELFTYLRRAGFQDVTVHTLPNGRIAAVGRKPFL
ncbi:MAG: class I SAM-dependent methyltransferase [Opitutaceae bacterium]|nr:class I SAM-dependent methyltransferase [Opitutaceae bacterium]